MPEIKLYNFDVGSLGNVCRARFDRMRFGELTVRFPEDYNDKISFLQQPQRVTQTISCCVGQPVEFTKKQTPIQFADGFIHTADLVVEDAVDVPQQSILLDPPLSDHGVSDFLELSTFFTGRRVVTDADKEMYFTDIQKRNNGCHLPLDATHAAWNNRHLLTESGLSIALNTLNSVRSNILQTLVYHYASAMDIIQTHMFTRGDYIDICKADKKKLKRDIDALLDTCVFQELSDDDAAHLKDAYKRILASRIDQGAFGPQDQLFSALKKLGILDGEISEATRKSIRVVNLIRNKVIHTGLFPNLSPSDTVLFGGMHGLAKISGAIMQNFCIIALCHTLKAPDVCYRYYVDQVKDFFQKNSLASLNTDDLFSPFSED